MRFVCPNCHYWLDDRQVVYEDDFTCPICYEQMEVEK